MTCFWDRKEDKRDLEKQYMKRMSEGRIYGERERLKEMEEERERE